MALDLLTTAVIAIIVLIAIIVIIKFGGVLLRILINAILGWILLVIVNLIPSVHIPINIITVLIAGFGGVFGVIFLLILQLLGVF
ncbi:MAG: pro-sigmaK processing inhibitor BofA family protein [Methanobacterium sp.]